MKKASLCIILLTGGIFFISGCEDDGSSTLCPQLVNFTIDCYEQVVGRSPSQQEISQWRQNCENTAHSNSCITCAMRQDCYDFLMDTDYVYNVLCADRCP